MKQSQSHFSTWERPLNSCLNSCLITKWYVLTPFAVKTAIKQIQATETITNYHQVLK